MNDKPLSGRRALVTGANKGIGLETARQLGQLGAAVMIGARDPDRGRAAARTLSAEGMDATALTFDVTNETLIAAAADEVRGSGGLDILVNNAGAGFTYILPSELTPAQVSEVLDTNLLGAIRMTAAFLPMLRASPAGRIVNVSSAMGSISKLGDPQSECYKVFLTPYSISKAALNAYTVLLASDLSDTAIKVNAVEPGFTATDFTGGQGDQGPADAARVVTKYASLGPDGPTGGYFDIVGPMPW